MKVPQILTVVFALIVIVDFFLNIPGLEAVSNKVQNWQVVIAAFALGLAAANLLRIHIRRIYQRRGNWINSLALVTVMVVQIFIGVAFGDDSPKYMFGFNNLLSPLGATMYSMLAFWIASAAYRAFRARSLDATILLIVGIIVMLGNAPIGEAIWDQFPSMKSWFMSVPTMSALRGLMISGAIGAIALGMRIFMGIERGHLGGSE